MGDFKHLGCGNAGVSEQSFSKNVDNQKVTTQKCAESPVLTIFFYRQQYAWKILKIVCKRANAFGHLAKRRSDRRRELAREKQTLGALQSIRGMHRLQTIFKTNLLRIATQNILKSDEA